MGTRVLKRHLRSAAPHESLTCCGLDAAARVDQIVASLEDYPATHQCQTCRQRKAFASPGPRPRLARARRERGRVRGSGDVLQVQAWPASAMEAYTLGQWLLHIAGQGWTVELGPLEAQRDESEPRQLPLLFRGKLTPPAGSTRPLVEAECPTPDRVAMQLVTRWVFENTPPSKPFEVKGPRLRLVDGHETLASAAAGPHGEYVAGADTLEATLELEGRA